MRIYDYLENGKTYVIAEMSANHGGSLERAKEIIHAACESGADCIKIQTYTADTLTLNCDNEFFRIKGGLWDGETFYSLYSKASTPWEWQMELKEEAESVGIDFLSTPFDNSAVDFLEQIGLGAYKIASFELIDIPLLRYAAKTGKPIILSTGMGTIEEIEEAVETIKNEGNSSIVLLRCASAYPAVTDEMNLATIVDLKNRFGLPVGLSDHSLGSIGVVTAVALGASVVEKHFCLSRSIDTADSAFSMEPEEFREMVEDIRKVEMAVGTVKYGPSKQEEKSATKRRSIFCAKDIKAGEAISEENIRIVRPGQGLHPRCFDDILGKRAKCDIKMGMPMSYDYLD